MEYTISNGHTTATAIIELLTVTRPHTRVYFKGHQNEFEITGIKTFRSKLLACYIQGKPNYKIVGKNVDKLLQDIISLL